jgi:hypothetical protein
MNLRPYLVVAYVVALNSWVPDWLQPGHDAEAAEYLVSDRATSRIVRYDAADGSFLGALVDDNLDTNGGLFAPTAMTLGFGGDLFVTSNNLNGDDGLVLRYDASTGAFKGVFASGLVGPAGLLYHQPSDTLLVGSLGTGLGDSNVISRFSADGAPVGTIESGPVSGRTGMVAAADGEVYVSSFGEQPFFGGAVLKYNYDSTSGAITYGDVFAQAQTLAGANGLLLDAGGDLLVASLFGQSAVKFDVEAGAVVGSSTFANAAYPSGVAIGIDGNVLLTSLGNNNPNDPIYGNNLFPGAVFKFDAATGAMIGAGPFMTGGAEFQPTGVLVQGLAGDLDGNGLLTAIDVDWLSAEVRSGAHLAAFDLNGDGQVDDADRTVWVEQLKHTYLGDANLDGRFDSSDLVQALAAGEYEDSVAGNSLWATGDWTGDLEFDTGDLIAAMQAGGYDLGPRPAVAAVPEPATMLLWCGAISLAVWKKRRRSFSRPAMRRV